MRGLQMALQAHFQLPVAVEPGGVDDGGPNGLRGGLTRSGGFDMSAARSMTALAIDSFRDAVTEERFTGREIRALAERVGGMAGQAAGDNGAPEVILVGAIVTGAHGPISTFLRVPTDWQFDERALGRAVQVASGVAAGSDNIVDLFLDDVSWFRVEIDLMAALEPLTVAFDHGVITIRRAGVERIVDGKVFDHLECGRTVKRSSHAGEMVGLGNFGVTTVAHGRVHVTRFGRCGRFSGGACVRAEEPKGPTQNNANPREEPRVSAHFTHLSEQSITHVSLDNVGSVPSIRSLTVAAQRRIEQSVTGSYIFASPIPSRDRRERYPRAQASGPGARLVVGFDSTAPCG